MRIGYDWIRHCIREKDLDEIMELLKGRDLEIIDYRDYEGAYPRIVARGRNLEVSFWHLDGGERREPNARSASDLSDDERYVSGLVHKMYKSPISRETLGYILILTSGAAAALYVTSLAK